MLKPEVIKLWRETAATSGEERRMIFPVEWRELCDLALKGLAAPEAEATTLLRRAFTALEDECLMHATRMAGEKKYITPSATVLDDIEKYLARHCPPQKGE